MAGKPISLPKISETEIQGWLDKLIPAIKTGPSGACAIAWEVGKEMLKIAFAFTASMSGSYLKNITVLIGRAAKQLEEIDNSYEVGGKEVAAHLGIFWLMLIFISNMTELPKVSNKSCCGIVAALLPIVGAFILGSPSGLMSDRAFIGDFSDIYNLDPPKASAYSAAVANMSMNASMGGAVFLALMDALIMMTATIRSGECWERTYFYCEAGFHVLNFSIIDFAFYCIRNTVAGSQRYCDR